MTLADADSPGDVMVFSFGGPSDSDSEFVIRVFNQWQPCSTSWRALREFFSTKGRRSVGSSTNSQITSSNSGVVRSEAMYRIGLVKKNISLGASRLSQFNICRTKE